jgi:hypothetical protein
MTTVSAALASNVTVYDYWTTLMAVPDDRATGLNRNINVTMYNTWVGQVNDVRMLGKTSVVWQEDGAISNSGQRTFWCGPDVYVLMVKIRSTGVLGNMKPRIGSANIS